VLRFREAVVVKPEVRCERNGMWWTKETRIHRQPRNPWKRWKRSGGAPL